MVESHNYQSANSRAQKLTNWTTLNRKVLTKFGFTIPRDIIEDIIQSKQQAVVLFLFGLRRVIEDRLQQNNADDNEPQVHWESPTNHTHVFHLISQIDPRGEKIFNIISEEPWDFLKVD